MDNFWNELPDMLEHLNEVQSIMSKSLRSKNKAMDQIMTELIHSNGKMIRPALCVIGSRFGSKSTEHVYHLAAVVEMLHLATLVHDDIVDNAKLRRNQETIQSKYGKDYAVYTGDFIFTKCFEILACNYEVRQMKELSQAISKICMGEISQFSNRHQKQTSIKNYLKIIGAKTSALLAISLSTGAYESGCDEKFSKRLGKIGFHIGNAFQIIDDILDYTGNERSVGKPVGNDLREGYFTLPMIYALRKNDRLLNELIARDCYDDEVIHSIIVRVHELGGVQEAKELAMKYTNKALTEIEKLPHGDGNEALRLLVGNLLQRNY